MRIAVATALAAVVAVLPAASVAVAAPTVPASIPVAADRAEQYVALGDSAAAGPIILPQRVAQPTPCRRSERNFPTLLAATLEVGSFTDATCSSAVIADLWSRQSPDAPPQLDAVRRSTTLVTLGPIGANDAELVQTVVGCLVPGCAERDGDSVRDAVDATRPDLVRALAAIKRKAPRAAVVVVGYGQYLPPGGCPTVQPITPADADYVQGLVDRLDGILEDVARRGGATFADLRDVPGAAEHTACAPAGERWLEGLVPTSNDGAIPFHPSALGMSAFAGQVAVAARRARVAQLRATTRRVGLAARCGGGQVVVTVRDPRRVVALARFAVGGRPAQVDRSRPFTVRVEPAPARRTVSVVVRTARPGASLVRRVERRLPACR